MKKILLSLLVVAMVTISNAQTWNYVTSTGSTYILFGMSFPPGQNNVGFACSMQYTVTGPGEVIKTTDGGDNWTTVHTSSDGLKAIWFINDTVGYAGGNNGYFIKTTDAGATWSNHPCGTSDVWYYNDIEFWDENNGAACAYMDPPGNSSIFITSDGGDTWTPASGVTDMMMNLSYADQNTLYAVSTTTLYKSTDGGMNWTSQPSLPGLLFAVDFVDANFGVIGAEEKIHSTNDGGATWQTYTTGYENFYATQVFDDGTAYVGGTDERIHMTTDFGNTWTLNHNGSGTSSPYRIRYTPNGVMTMCGSQGTIVQSTPLFAAQFSADNTSVCEGDVVTFTDQSSGTPVSWTWTFPGGTPSSSTAQNPTVTYNTAGTYDVTLEVSNGSTTSTLTETDYITVDAIPAQAGTPSGPAAVCGGEIVDYTVTAVSGADTYLWEVSPSDAGSITGSGTTGTFTAATDWTGDYVVRVRASNSCGNNGFSPDFSATLYHMPVLYFLGGGGSYCEGGTGLELTLDGSETGVDYELYFDGTATGNIVAGTGSAISFGFQTDEGFYTANGYTSNCSIDMMGQPYISIVNLPGMSGTPSGPDVVCNTMTTTYTTVGGGDADTLIWILDPASAGALAPSGDMVEIEWDVAYIGAAQLSVYGSNDCGDGPVSPELEITVNESPVPEISGNSIVCEDDEEVYSTNNSGNSFLWVVEGGTVTSGAGTNEITVLWGDPGDGLVRVIENNGACHDSTEISVEIQVCPGITEPDEENFKIYPNPANSIVNIEFVDGNNEGYKLKVWSSHGTLMDQVSISEGVNNTELNVSDYPSGIYFIELTTQTEIYKKLRFIVNH